MFRDQAERLGFAFDRLAAVDAHNCTQTRGRLTPGEIACFESHRKAWQLLVDSGEPWLAVFEDDALLAHPIATLLASDRWIPVQSDIVKLETFEARVAIAAKGISVEGVSLHRLQTAHCGSAGYILSRQCAIDLLRQTKNFTRPVDIVLFDHEHEVSRKLQILQMVPAVCIQERFIADRVQQLPRADSLISRSEVAPASPGQSGPLTKLKREGTRIMRQFSSPVRLSRLVRRALQPSRHLVVPYIEA